MKNKKIIISFACVQNSCRSQIAEYFAKKHNKNPNLKFNSFGSVLAPKVNKRAIEMIQKIYGDNISNFKPKTILDIEKPDYVISMGCEVACPTFVNGFYENWELPDPVKLSDEEFIKILKTIEENVIKLIEKFSNKNL